MRAVANVPRRPGMHSHNHARLLKAEREPRPPVIRLARALLVLAGLLGVGLYLYSVADEYVYQKYENWVFDREIAGGTNVSFSDFLRNEAGQPAPFARRRDEVRNEPAKIRSNQLTAGEVLGRVSIARLHLSAIVREGVDRKILSNSVGHIPTTSLPGRAGNFAIAAHRDTLFRALKGIRNGDIVTMQTASATYQYKVMGTMIVRPSNVSVLRSDGGGFIQGRVMAGARLLTMITCYPFYYVGSAPKRFIVQGELISE